MSLPVQIAADLLLSVPNVNRAQREIENAVGGGARDGLTKAIRESQREIKTSYSKAFNDAVRVGSKEQARQLENQYQSQVAKQKELATKRKDLSAMILATEDKAQKARLSKERKALKQNMKDGQDHMMGLIRTQANAQADSLKLLDEGMAKAGEKFSDKAESAAENFTDLVNKGLTLDNLDPADLVKGLGKSLKNQSGNLMSGGKKMAAWGANKGGATGGAAKMIGKFGMKLGKLAGPLAAVAVAVGAVVGVLAAAYNKVKDWNKAILEGASAVDILGGMTGDLEKNMGNMRSAMSRVSRSYHISAEAAYKYIGALNEAGITVSELKGWTDASSAVRGYTRAMVFGMKYTKALGISTDELGTIQQRMMNAYGMRMQALDDTMQNFGKAAQMAGMNSRSFSAAVMEGTANMALYNFRLGDTLELMVGLAGILGDDLAKSMLQMEGTFKNMSTQDRYKASMTGGGVMEDVLQGGARRQIEGRAADISLDTDLAAAFRAAGLTDFGDNFDIDKLASLSGLELGRVQDEIRRDVTRRTGSEDAGRGAVRGLEDLTMQARLLSGGATTAEKADAMSAMDRPTEIAASVAQAIGMMPGVEDFGDITATNRMQFESLSGIQGEQFEVVKEIFNTAQARHSATEGGRDVSLSETLVHLSTEGADALLTPEQIEALNEPPAAEDEMLGLARQTLDATQTVGDILGGLISGLLGGIGGTVTRIGTFLANEFNGFVGNNKAAREAIVEADENIARLLQESVDIKAAERALEGNANLSPEQKEAERKRLETELEDNDRQKNAYENMKNDIMDRTVGASGGREEFVATAYADAKDGQTQEQATAAKLAGDLRSATLGGDAELAQLAEGAVDGFMLHGIRQADQMGSRQTAYGANETESGYLDRGLFSVGLGEYTTGRNVKNDDGTIQNQAQAALERSGMNPAEMMEFQRAQALAQKKSRTEQLKADAQAAKDATAQIKTEQATEQGIRNIVKELKNQSNEDLADQVQQALTASGSTNTNLGLDVYEGKTGSDLSGLKTQLGLGGYTAKEIGLLRRLGISTTGLTVGADAKDFIYQGDAMGGLITHIDDQDSFFGAKPGGALSKMGGGRSIVISNLTINESGNPEKTLQMVKRALAAANRTA
jgi:hypothetical protein